LLDYWPICHLILWERRVEVSKKVNQISRND
jgi:hypothetical protein